MTPSREERERERERKRERELNCERICENFAASFESPTALRFLHVEHREGRARERLNTPSNTSPADLFLANCTIFLLREATRGTIFLSADCGWGPNFSTHFTPFHFHSPFLVAFPPEHTARLIVQGCYTRSERLVQLETKTGKGNKRGKESKGK